MSWVRCTEQIREIRNIYKSLAGNLEGKILLRRDSYRWEDNHELDLRETGLEGVDQ
jgi:hypothetical protein